MRVIAVVDGYSEYHALPKIWPQLEEQSSVTFIKFLKAELQPGADAQTNAKECARVARRPVQVYCADLVIVLMDRDSQVSCPGKRAQDLATEVRSRLSGTDVEVVIKNNCFENWLVSDVVALCNMPKRFRVTSAFTQKIVPNLADQVDALKMLSMAAIKRKYDKIPDSTKILEQADVNRMASNSRSFRRFLRLLSHQSYLQQSKIPVIGHAPTNRMRRRPKRR